MSCDAFIEGLDRLLDGTLPPDETREARRHLRECPRCRVLHSVLASESEAPSAPPPTDLTGRILERTSGSPCASARKRLADFVDRQLAPLDDELVRMHVGGCAECAALARVVARLPEDLSSLAELRPDERFVGDVLRATLPRHVRVSRRLQRLVDSWRGWSQRPRFALEAAYVGTIVLLLAFATPGSPLAGVPARALELARVNPVAELEQPLGNLETQVRVHARAARQRFVAVTREAGTGLAGRASAALREIRGEFGTMWDRLTSGQVTEPGGRTEQDGDET